MPRLFKNAKFFDQDVSTWETKVVTTMKEMFLGAAAFNQELKPDGDSWNTVAVTDMTGMFQGATSFNNGGKVTIQNFDTTALKNTKNMFNGAEAFDQPIPTSGTKWKMTA